MSFAAAVPRYSLGTPPVRNACISALSSPQERAAGQRNAERRRLRNYGKIHFDQKIRLGRVTFGKVQVKRVRIAWRQAQRVQVERRVCCRVNAPQIDRQAIFNEKTKPLNAERRQRSC